MKYEEWQKQINYLDEKTNEWYEMIKSLEKTITFLYQCIEMNRQRKQEMACHRFDIKTGEEIEEKK